MKLPSKTLDEWTYTLKEERDLPDPDRTRWLMRALSFNEDTILVNRISGGLGDGDTAKLCLLAGLIGFENLRVPSDTNPEGEELVPELRRVNPLGVHVRSVKVEQLDLIPSKIRHELAGAIAEHGRTNEDDEKN